MLLHEFDPNETAIFNPSMVFAPIEGMPKVAVSCFSSVTFARMLALFPDAEVIAYGVKFINIITPFYIFLCFNQIQAGALRGTGNAKAPMVVMLFSFVAFRQMYLFTVSRLFPGNLVVISLGYPMGWMLCSALMFLYYKSGKWKKRIDVIAPSNEVKE